MFKKIILTLFVAVLANIAIAQHTKEFTQTDKLFHEGKELFDQRKYSASFRDFEEFLKTTHPTDAGMIMEAEYYMCCNSYELRQADAKSRLENYLENHPYTPYSDRTQYMLGMLSYESKKYTQALNHFRKIDETHLIDKEKIDLLFCRGYANLQTGNTVKALEIFKTLKVMESRYQPTARYYTGYCEYVLGNYEAALPDLLAVETHPEFEDVAPYYITQIYYSLKNYSEVDKRADFLLKKYPDSKYNAELYRINGERSYATGNYIKAIENLKNYEKISPTVMRNDMYYLGISYVKTNQSQQAIQYLSKVTTQNDEMSENAYLQLGNAYINSGDKNNARMAFEAATRTNFNNFVREEALYNYALTTYETTTAFGESVKAFEQFIAEFPNSKHADQAYDYLSTVYLTSKNYRAAYESVSKIKKLNPKLLETKQYLEYQLGTEAFAASNYPKATDFFTKALTTAPNTKNITDIYFWRAESNYRTKDFAKSESDLLAYFNQPNVAKNQNYLQALYSLGYAYFGQKKYNEALNWFLKYVNLENKISTSVYSDALNRIGDIHFHSRNFDKATEYYDKANSSSSYNGDYALFQSAYTSGLQKNYNLKISKLEQLMTKYPGSEYGDDALYEIARACLMLENDNKAIVTYNRLVSTYPNSNLAPKALLETGMVNFNEKDYTNAIPAFKKVIADYP